MKTIEEIRQLAEEKVGHMTSFHKGIWAAGYLTCQADQEKEDLETENGLLSKDNNGNYIYSIADLYAIEQYERTRIYPNHDILNKLTNEAYRRMDTLTKEKSS